MIGLITLEVYNSVFNITEENHKLELYKFPGGKVGGVSHKRVRDEVEKDLDVSDIAATDLQDEIVASIIFKGYSEQVTKRKKDGQYLHILTGYRRFLFQDFESSFRTVIDFVEDDI